jgi:hypothetical protein
MADPSSGPNDIDKLDAITSKGMNSSDETPSDSFKQHMQTPTEEANGSKAPTPMDVVNGQKISPSAPPTMESVRAQMNTASGSLGDIKQHLDNKDLNLKSSDKYLVRKKLTSAHDHLKTAAEKVGVNTGDFDAKLNKSKSPIARFLMMVTDGQNQMAQAAASVKNLSANGQSISPAELLLVQVKLSKAQQELNYTSTILGNATSMIKTLFNTQV